jgi:hypothetical protein
LNTPKCFVHNAEEYIVIRFDAFFVRSEGGWNCGSALAHEAQISITMNSKKSKGRSASVTRNCKEFVGTPMENKFYVLHVMSQIKHEMKSKRMRWAGHVARIGRRGKHIGYWWQSQKERDHY